MPSPTDELRSEGPVNAQKADTLISEEDGVINPEKDFELLEVQVEEGKYDGNGPADVAATSQNK